MNKEVEEAKMIFNKLKEVNEELQKDEEEGHGSAYEMQAEDFNAIETILNYIKELEDVLNKYGGKEELEQYMDISIYLGDVSIDCFLDRIQESIHKERELAEAQTTYEVNEIWKQKIRDKIEELSKTKGDIATYMAIYERIKVLYELLNEEE